MPQHGLLDRCQVRSRVPPGSALAGKHVQVPCLQCHADRRLGRGSYRVATCHAKDDAHQGNLGADCGACHDASAWSKVTFDHGRTKFPLNGKHAGLPCSNCHQDPRVWRHQRYMRGLPREGRRGPWDHGQRLWCLS